MEFIIKNVNPKQKKACDCVIRAIALAENKDWYEVYDGLYEIGRKKCDILNSKKVYEAYLKQNGWIKQKMPKKDNGKRYTINEFFDYYKKVYKNETVIVTVANHMTCIKNNVLYDSWNCSHKSIGNYWTKSSFNI